jgi:hypothetical protein
MKTFKVLGIDFSLDLNCITDVNFTKKIKEFKAILKSWQHRKLTLLGKITVITRYDYHLTIMKSPEPATDNRFKK